MRFDKSLIKILLGKFEPGVEHYTHHFVNCCSSFTGSDSMPLIRKYLDHLLDRDYVIRHKYKMNIHKWSITQGGQDVLKLLQSDCFIL